MSPMQQIVAALKRVYTHNRLNGWTIGNLVTKHEEGSFGAKHYLELHKNGKTELVHLGYDREEDVAFNGGELRKRMDIAIDRHGIYDLSDMD